MGFGTDLLSAAPQIISAVGSAVTGRPAPSPAAHATLAASTQANGQGAGQETLDAVLDGHDGSISMRELQEKYPHLVEEAKTRMSEHRIFSNWMETQNEGERVISNRQTVRTAINRGGEFQVSEMDHQTIDAYGVVKHNVVPVR